MKKRVFSALLCLVMVIGLLPGIALADQKAAPEAPAATQIPMTSRSTAKTMVPSR